MGREQYLTRLALGRSAFLPLGAAPEHEASGTPKVPAQRQGHAESDGGNEGYDQQYDVKGRPINPAIDARDADLRRAQNDVLCLVGVLERDDVEDASRSTDMRKEAHERAEHLAMEHQIGNELELQVSVLALAADWWTSNLLMRALAGLYGENETFVGMLRRYSTRTIPGWQGYLALLSPGEVTDGLHFVLRAAMTMATTGAIGRLQKAINKWGSKYWSSRLFDILNFVNSLSVFGIDVILLPLKQWAILQKLGLVEPLCWLPPLITMLPPGSNEASSHRNLWSSILPSAQHTKIGVLFSTGMLMILRDLVYNPYDLENTRPTFDSMTRYRLPGVNAAGPRQIAEPMRDPIGYVLWQVATLRMRLMKFCGWNIHSNTTRIPLREHEDNISLPGTLRRYTRPGDVYVTGRILPMNTPDDGRKIFLEDAWIDDSTEARVRQLKVYKSTSLAHLPATVLAGRIDEFLCRRIIPLPLELLTLRCIAWSWSRNPLASSFGSPIPGASFTAYRPFGGLSALFSTHTSAGFRALIRQASTYASKVGLALAIDATVSIGLVAGSWLMARWYGHLLGEIKRDGSINNFETDIVD